MHKSKVADLRRVFVVYSLFFLFSLSACSTRQGIPIGQVPLAQPPTTEERQTSMAAVDAHIRDGGFKPVKDKSMDRRVRNVVDRLARAAGAEGFSYPVMVVDAGDEVNAAAVNGATILVYQKLLERIPEDGELAAVLGHEIGHILGRHHLDHGAESRAQGVSLAKSILGAAASIGASAAGVDSSTANMAGDVTSGVTEVVGTGAFVRSYDRDMEREADHVGMMLMAKAGYNPEGAIHVWSRAQEIFGSGDGFTFLSTHPSSKDRLTRLAEALPIAQSYYQAATPATPSQSTPAKKKGKKRK